MSNSINQNIKIVGDRSLSKRDFSRVTKPLNLFGVKTKSKNTSLPIEIKGSKLLRPIDYYEDKGSAQVKTCIILSAINTSGTTKIKAKKSRNHTELLLKYLKYPIKIKKNNNYDFIEVQGLNQYKSFDYTVPGDISSASFFIVLTLLSKNSKLTLPVDRSVNETKSIQTVAVIVKPFFVYVFSTIGKTFSSLNRLKITSNFLGF